MVGGGASNCYPCQKVWGGAQHILAMSEGGGEGGATQSFRVILTWELEVLVIPNGGGVQKVSDLRFPIL